MGKAGFCSTTGKRASLLVSRRCRKGTYWIEAIPSIAEMRPSVICMQLDPCRKARPFSSNLLEAIPKRPSTNLKVLTLSLMPTQKKQKVRLILSIRKNSRQPGLGNLLLAHTFILFLLWSDLRKHTKLHSNLSPLARREEQLSRSSTFLRIDLFEFTRTSIPISGDFQQFKYPDSNSQAGNKGRWFLSLD